MSRPLQYVILVVAAVGALVFGMQIAKHQRGDRADRADYNGETAAKYAAEASGELPTSFAAFEMQDVNGATRNSSEWQGKTLLVNFWATWCAPCREEIPVFSAVSKTWAERGLEVVGIALDDAQKVRRFGDEIGLDYHSLIAGRDSGFELLERHNPTSALPFSLLVAPDGRIIERKLGIWHAADLDAVLEKHLP